MRFLYKMNDFLKQSYQLKSLKENLCFVLGNESCDLDSAISSLALAFYYQNENKFNKYKGFIPVFNILKTELPLKTEVTYFLKENSINSELITFIDDVESDTLKNNDIILVDHHLSPYPLVIEVIDHRPYDENANFNENCIRNIDLVGSCCTLIANKILEEKHLKKYENILKMLYDVIIVDTINFSPEADRARPLDIDVSNKIEENLKIPETDVYKKNLFENIVNARSDISSLNSYQLLFKDMKTISNKSEDIVIALPGYPTLVQTYIQLENAKENIEKFAKELNCSIILLIGMKIFDKHQVKRDLGLININNKELYDKILESLNNSADLCLEKIETCNFMDGAFFNQNNIKVSRKQILPIVKGILDSKNT